MKSYEQIAQEAGTTVDVVREVAKTIYEDVTGWHEAHAKNTDPWAPGYATKTEAIIAVAKRKQAEADKRKAEQEAEAATTRKQAASIAGKAMDADAPMRIYTEDCAIYDYIAGVEGDSAIVTEHFGAVGIDDMTEVMPWDMAATDRPMLCAYGVTLKCDSGDYAHSWYESSGTNRKVEHLVVEMDTIEGGTTRGWLLTTWAKRGLIPHMASAWNTNVYVRKQDKTTRQAYNPQITPNGEIDFSWIREKTDANRLALLLEILKRFSEAE